MANEFLRTLIGLFQYRTEADLGLSGHNYIKDTNLHNGQWFVIKADSQDVVFETLTVAKGDNLNGYILNGGDVLFGDFTAIKISTTTPTAKLIAYKKP